MTLDPHHHHMLSVESAIAADVIVARGYWSATTKAELARLGFGPSQQQRPALVVPIYNVRGDLATHMLRPDQPRAINGKPAKYEFMRGLKMVLDAPVLPAMRAHLDDPNVPLWITEGSKKVDALLSIGCCTVGVIGVWNWRGTNAKGGKVMLPDWEYIALNDRETYICYDSDVMVKPEVYGGLCRLAESLKMRQAHVRYVYLPPGPSGAKQGVDDYLAGGGALDDLLGLATVERRAPPDGPDADGRPIIHIRPDITAVVDEALTALARMADAPRLFQRARKLSRVVHGASPPPWLTRAPDAPVIVTVDAPTLRELAVQAARWQKYDKRADEWEDCLPPPWAMETAMARGLWSVPVLEGVVTAPTLRPDGSVIETPGYDASTGLYFDSRGLVYPPLRSHPTLDDARSAIGILQEVFIDFLWLDSPNAPGQSHHFSAALAGVLSLAARSAITGCVPLFAVDASTRGSGKGLLVDAIAVSATGRPAPRWPQVLDPDEERKRLLALVLDGDACLHIDNVTEVFGSPALNLALTSTMFKDRVLGRTENREAPMRAVFFASGNNLRYATDIARRVIPISLDPRMERPEERTGFQHSPLLPWVTQEHPRLLVAALTILRAYFEAGCPAQSITPMGSFEEWSDLVRQSLIWAGETDPCMGRTNLETESDRDYEQLSTLLATWEQCYPIGAETGRSMPKTLREVCNDIASLKQLDKPPLVPGQPNTPNEYDMLQDALGAFDVRYDSKGLRNIAIGHQLRVIQGRVIGTRRLIGVGRDRTNNTMWSLETTRM